MITNLINDKYLIINQLNINNLDDNLISNVYNYITNIFKDYVADFNSDLLYIIDKNNIDNLNINPKNYYNSLLTLDMSDFSFQHINYFMNKHLPIFEFVEQYEYDNNFLYPYLYKLKDLFSNEFENNIMDINDIHNNKSNNIYIMFSRYQLLTENKIFIPTLIFCNRKLQYRYLFQL
jgi:hypothetical protein